MTLNEAIANPALADLAVVILPIAGVVAAGIIFNRLDAWWQNFIERRPL